MRDFSATPDSLVELLPVGVLVLDTDLSIVTCNRRAMDFLGLEPDDILGGTLPERPENAPFMQLIANEADGNSTRRRETLTLGERTVRCSLHQLGERNDGNTAIVLEDSAETKRLEQVKQDFITTILHRFRNPLGSLKTSLSVLGAESSSLSSEAREILGMSCDEVDRLNTLLADLRDLLYIETNLAGSHVEPENFAVGEVLPRVYRGLGALFPGTEPERRITLRGNAGAVVRADYEKVTRILLILLTNALAYDPQGGPVMVEIDDLDSCVSLAVKDRGVGIAEESMPLLFTKFFREHDPRVDTVEGNGLGLFIARSWLDLMGGSISCESEKNKGTTVTITLPTAEKG